MNHDFNPHVFSQILGKEARAFNSPWCELHLDSTLHGCLTQATYNTNKGENREESFRRLLGDAHPLVTLSFTDGNDKEGRFEIRSGRKVFFLPFVWAEELGYILPLGTRTMDIGRFENAEAFRIDFGGNFDVDRNTGTVFLSSGIRLFWFLREHSSVPSYLLETFSKDRLLSFQARMIRLFGPRSAEELAGIVGDALREGDRELSMAPVMV